MIVAEIDAGEVLLLPIQINEVREIVDRFQDGDESVLQRQVDVGPTLGGRQLNLNDNSADHVAKLVLNLELPHSCAPSVNSHPPLGSGSVCGGRRGWNMVWRGRILFA